MSVTYLYNNKTFDFSGGYIEVNNADYAWEYTIPALSVWTTTALIANINNAFSALAQPGTPYFKIGLFEKPTVVYAASNLPYDDPFFTLEITTNASLQLVLGCIDKEVTPVAAFLSSIPTLPYWGITRLPSVTDLLEACGEPTGGGITITDPVEMDSEGEDFVSRSKVESSDYFVLGGFEFPFRYHESQLRALTNFINEARGEVLEFINDTWNIGRGYKYYLLPHTGKKASTVYNYLDISKKGLYMLKEEDFNEV